MLSEDGAVVPAIWPFEMANALRMAERRQRVRPAEIRDITAALSDLPITVVTVSLEQALGAILEVARAHQLSNYDAAYLELAMRQGLPLATQDVQLRAAAARAGVPLVQ